MTYWQRWKKVAIHNQALVIVGVLAFAITGINVVVVCFQAYLSEHNSKEASAQTDRLIANSKEISKALQESVAQSKEALDVSITASSDDRRAWVLPYRAEILSPMEAGKDLSARLFARNTGKTPAVIMLAVRWVVAPELTEDYLRDESWIKEQSQYLVAPDAFIQSEPQFHAPFTENAVANVKAGTDRLFLYGRIRYDDVFGRPHTTRFCFYSKVTELTDGLMLLYEKGNSAD